MAEYIVLITEPQVFIIRSLISEVISIEAMTSTVPT